MKKILLLGGSAQQVSVIKKSRELGYYTVLCDYLPDNPGQYEADRFYLVSTTDKEAVLEVAKSEMVDGVLAYASDPAAPTAAYVAEQLRLPGNPYDSVEILCNKDRFREFLQAHDFHTPLACGYHCLEDAIKDFHRFSLPVIVKPVDSSGSKGVSKVTDAAKLPDAVAYAMEFSRAKRIIIEEWVEKYGYQIAGDGLSIDGKLVFYYFANDHFDTNCVNPFVPVSASFPYCMPQEVHEKIALEIQRLLTLLQMKTCTYNFDIRIDKDQNVYLMEIAPRDGGNCIPEVIQYATGVDLAEYAIRGAMGEQLQAPKAGIDKGYYAYYAVHSLTDGILQEIQISSEAYQHILENHILVKPGDHVKAFTGANTTLGILLMRFDSMEQMLDMMDHSENWIKTPLKEEIQNDIF